MAEIPTVAREIQDEVLKTVRRSQEFVTEAIRTWADAVQSITPKLPPVDLPFASQLPRPKDVVDNAYDFAAKLLASQRKFAEDVLKAAAPLAPGRSNGNATAPSTPKASTATEPSTATGPSTEASAPKAGTGKTSAAKASTGKHTPKAGPAE